MICRILNDIDNTIPLLSSLLLFPKDLLVLDPKFSLKMQEGRKKYEGFVLKV